MRRLSCECEPFNDSGAPRAEREGHKNNSIAKKSNGIVLTPLPSVVRPLPVRGPSARVSVGHQSLPAQILSYITADFTSIKRAIKNSLRQTNGGKKIEDVGQTVKVSGKIQCII